MTTVAETGVSDQTGAQTGAQRMTVAKAEALRVIEQEVGVMVHRVRRNSVENAHEVHPELLPGSYPVLIYVVDEVAARASDIVHHFGIDKGAVSRHLAHLERLGLVERTSDPDDGRAQNVVASSIARRAVAAMRKRRRSTFADRLAGWDDDELQALAEQLARYNASMTG